VIYFSCILLISKLVSARSDQERFLAFVEMTPV